MTTTVPAHSAPPAPAPAGDPPVIRCKKCKISLPDTAWKNCSSCRKSRTESCNRYRKSVSMRSMGTMNLTFISSTPSQAPGPTANEPSHYVYNVYGDPSGSSRLASDQSRKKSVSTAPPPAEAIEYQWPDELIAALLALPPRSRYIGKFSIIADPAVNNSARAQLFADQLLAGAVPISGHGQLSSLNPGSTNSCTFVAYCSCQEGCQGRFVVSVDDDPSHPYGVPGQRVGVVVVHPGPPD